MQNVSSEYLLEIKKPSRSFECKVTIRDNIYTNADIINITIEDVQPSDGFSIGSAVSKSLELTLSTNNTIYSNSIVKVEIGLNVGSKIEYVLMGYFNIDDIEKTDYSIKLTCFDNMMKFEKPYFSKLGKTASLKNIVNELSQITGVEFTGSLPSYNLNKLEGFTCREVLGFISSLCAGNAYITRDGKFTINTLKTIDYSITDENYIDLKTEENIYKIGAVTCKINEKELTKGTLSNSSMEVTFENPWVNDSILTDIYNKLKSIEYVGYSMKWQGDLSLDVGDIISLTDHKGVKRNIPILSQKFNYNGGLTSEIGAKGESKNKNEFNSTGNLSNKVNRVVTELLIVNEALINKADIEELKAVNATIDNLLAENVTITGKLTAIEGEFGTLKANVGVIDKLTVTHTAQINELEANKASITQLEAVSAKIGTVEAEVGKIQTLVNGNLSSENIQAGGITSDKLTIANGFITNAMISNLDVSKINAGDISTNKFRIKSDDGGIEIVGATQQFKDKNNKVRVQIGRDTNNNFTFSLFDETGIGVLIDHTGIKEGAIADDLIISDMIASDAVGEKQINYSSFITGFNKDTNTNTIKSTKIMLNNQNQTLDVAFNQLKTQADDTKSLTESHSTIIGVIQGQITTAINNTQIVRDGQTILLKDDYNRTVQTVNSMNSTIGSHTTKINEHTGKITGVETRVNTVERDLDGITARVSSTEKNVTTVTNTANAANSNATNALNKANSANTLADSKAKVFTSQPTVPYKVGDLWVQGTTGDVMKCKTARTTGSYTTSDWEKASKYTDDTKANAVDGKVTTLEGTVSATTSKVAEITTNLEGITQRVSTVENKQTTVDGKVTSLQTRMQSAEQKLTKEGLTTIISNHYTNSNDVNEIVTSKGYQTHSQVQQIVDKLQIKFTESGGYNKLYNSAFANGLANWTIRGTPTETTIIKDETVEGRKYLKLNTDSNGQGLRQTVKVQAGKKYTFSAKVTRETGTIVGLEIYHNGKWYNKKTNDTEAYKNSIISITVTAEITGDMEVRIGRGGFGTNGISRWYWTMFTEGELVVPWSPHHSEVYDGITTIDKDGITVTSSNVKSKTTISANGFKIIKTDTNEEVFKVNSSGRLELYGIFRTRNGDRKSGYFGENQITFYNWWNDTNEAIAYFYGGKTSDGKRSADIVGRDVFSLGVGQPSSGTKVLEGSSSTLNIYKNTNFNNYKLKEVNSINEDIAKSTFIEKIVIRSNQVNTNHDGGNLNLNYWRGYNAPTSVVTKVCNGNNDGSRGTLHCQDFKAYGTKNACVQASVGYVDINAYETCDYYFGDIGETILDSEGYSYVYIDSLFSETVNTQRKYQVFLSVYGEGIANVIERYPTHFIIKGTPGIEIGYEIKAKRKGYEDYRLEREVNSWMKGREHGLDIDYTREKENFNNSIVNKIEDIIDLDNTQLVEFVDRSTAEFVENKDLMEIIEEDLNYESIN